MKDELNFYQRPILIRNNSGFIYSELRFSSQDQRVENITKYKNKEPNEWFLKDILQIYPHLTYYKNRIQPIKKLETIFLNSVHEISKNGYEEGFDSKTIELDNILYIMDLTQKHISGSISKIANHQFKKKSSQKEQESIFKLPQKIEIKGYANDIGERYLRKNDNDEDYNRWITVKKVNKFGEKLSNFELEFLKQYIFPGEKTLIINQKNLIKAPELIF